VKDCRIQTPALAICRHFAYILQAQETAMPVTLSIRDVPDDIAEQLRARAKRNHRSLQGELMAIAENAANPAEGFGVRDTAREYRIETPTPEKRKLTTAEISVRAQTRAIYQPGDELSVDVIRRMRDERGEHIMRILDENR
jgi:plasmid stability protein